jgi:hypothetical protein
MESNKDYRADIPTPEELKVLEEFKKYKNTYDAIKDQPEFVIKKIDKLLKAVFSL